MIRPGLLKSDEIIVLRLLTGCFIYFRVPRARNVESVSALSFSEYSSDDDSTDEEIERLASRQS